MPIVFYISHPQVIIDPLIPVPQWQLSNQGLARLQNVDDKAWVCSIERFYSSTEDKAIQTATALAQRNSVEVVVGQNMGEIDRSSTGYVPHDEHEKIANKAFANPNQSVRGWEKAIDAQARVVEAVEKELKKNHRSTSTAFTNIAFVGHGGVGTFLLCHLLNEPIGRKFDQPFGGHVFAFDAVTRQVLFPWLAIENVNQRVV